MLSVARDRPVDPLAIEILKQIDPVARALGIEYLVTGATARDILLVGVFGLETGRGTRDVDLAIAVDGWPQFAAVKTRLVEAGRVPRGVRGCALGRDRSRLRRSRRVAARARDPEALRLGRSGRW
jgi:predicted nucleotidyltransferase